MSNMQRKLRTKEATVVLLVQSQDNELLNQPQVSPEIQRKGLNQEPMELKDKVTATSPSPTPR